MKCLAQKHKQTCQPIPLMLNVKQERCEYQVLLLVRFGQGIAPRYTDDEADAVITRLRTRCLASQHWRSWTG